MRDDDIGIELKAPNSRGRWGRRFLWASASCAALVTVPFAIDIISPTQADRYGSPAVGRAIKGELHDILGAMSDFLGEVEATSDNGLSAPEEDEALAEEALKPDISQSHVSPGIAELRQKYGSILPEQISIPATLPDLTRIITVADAMAEELERENEARLMAAGADEEEGEAEAIVDPLPAKPQMTSPLLRYALGEDGISDELAQAFRTVVDASEGEISRMDDAEVAIVASERIGYVPAGVDPADIRVPGGALEGPGRVVVSGQGEIISAHQIMVGEQMIRLQGVRAPNSMDLCTGPTGETYDCVGWAREGMDHIVSTSELTCAVTAEEHEEGGRIGWCNLDFGGKTRDLAGIAVGAGILMTVPGKTGVSPYDDDEAQARDRKLGLWSGSIRDRNAPELPDLSDLLETSPEFELDTLSIMGPFLPEGILLDSAPVPEGVTEDEQDTEFEEAPDLSTPILPLENEES